MCIFNSFPAFASLRLGVIAVALVISGSRCSRESQMGAKNPGRRRGILCENAHFVHEQTGFLRGAARGLSSICNLETFSLFGLVKMEFRALNGGMGILGCGIKCHGEPPTSCWWCQGEETIGCTRALGLERRMASLVNQPDVQQSETRAPDPTRINLVARSVETRKRKGLQSLAFGRQQPRRPNSPG